MSILLLLFSGLATGTLADPEPEAQGLRPLDGPLGPNVDLSLEGATELTDDRTRFSKTWILENGTYMSRISQSPLHYFDAQETWQDIDPTIMPITQPDLSQPSDLALYGNTKNALQSHFGLDGRVKITNDDARVTWVPQRLAVHDAARTLLDTQQALDAAPMANGNKVSWTGLFPGATDRYTVERGLVKHDLVLHERLLQSDTENDNQNGTFALEGTLELSPGLLVFSGGEEKTQDFVSSGEIHFFNPDGTLAFIMGSVYAYDASNDQGTPSTGEDDQSSPHARSWIEGRTRVRFTDDGLVVSLEVPSDWIHSDLRDYPVTIDPTWGWDDVDASIYVREGEGNKNSESWLYSGATTEWNWGCFCFIGKANRIFLRQDLSPLDNRIISVITARLNHYVETTDSVAHEARFVPSDSWHPASMTWTSQPGTFSFIGNIFPTSTGWKTFFSSIETVENQISGDHVQKFFGDDQFSYRIHRSSGELQNSEKYMRIYRFGNNAPEWLVSYQVDTTPPSTGLSISGTTGLHDWYRSSVDVSLTCSDFGAGCHQTLYNLDGSPFQSYFSPFDVSKEGTTTLEYQSKDRVLNMEVLRSAQIKIDTVAPVTTSSLSGTLGDNDWYRSSVDVSLSCTDATSGCMTTRYRVNDESWQSGSSPTLDTSGVNNLEYRTPDAADNWEIIRSKEVKIDSLDPEVSHSLSGTEGSNGWYRSPVTVTLSATDAHSGVATIEYQLNFDGWQTYTGPFEIAEQGHTELSYRTTDVAGNIKEIFGPLVKIDYTVPEIGAFFEGTGKSGWYNSSVDVDLYCIDWDSGCFFIEYRLNGGNWQIYTGTFEINNEGITTLDFRGTDDAGNTFSEFGRLVRIDTTPPHLEGSRAPLANSNGWNNEDVTVSFDCSDDLSGVDTVSGPVVLSDEGAGLSVTGFCQDIVGNAAQDTVEDVHIDKTSPMSQYNLTGNQGDDEWFLSTVDVALAADDSLSGVLLIEYRVDAGPWTLFNGTFTINDEGNNTLEVRATDLAMNIEHPIAAEISIDVTPPSTNLTPGLPFAAIDGTRFVTSDTPFMLEATDGTSGIGHTEYTTNGGGHWTQQTEFNLIGEDGPKLIGYRTIDVAGNQEETRFYEVTLDNEAPGSTHDYNGTAYTRDNLTFLGPTTLIEINATDASEVATIMNRTDSDTFGVYADPFRLPGADGPKTLEYFAVDVLGNTEAPQTHSLFLDATSPTTQLHVGEPTWVDPGGDRWVTSGTLLSLTSEDPLQGGDASGLAMVEYRLGEGDWSPYAEAFTLPATQASWNVSFRATDNAGNVETPKSAIFQMDDQPPEVDLQRPSPGSLTTSEGYFEPAPNLELPLGPDYAYATEGTPLLIDALVTDLGWNPSGVQNVTFLVEGEIIETMTQGPYQWSWDTTGLPLGEYEIEVLATDMLGNASATGVTIFLLPGTMEGILNTISDLAGG